MIELLTTLFESLAASWGLTAIWSISALLILALSQYAAGWWLDFTEWIKNLF